MSERLPYFCTPERIDALRSTLDAWRGTRWAHAGVRPNEMRCGISGDCLFWVHAFKAIGALPEGLLIPEYRRMEAAADKMQLLRARIMETGRAELVFVAANHIRGAAKEFRGYNALPGDVLLFANGMSGVHCGLVVKPAPMHFFHVSQNGALEEPFNQGQWLASIAYAYRLMEPETDSATVPVAVVSTTASETLALPGTTEAA